MFTNKRGVSPLIATVLIIGFTVALAAIIFTWGQSFVRETTEQTAQAASSAIDCANLNFEVRPSSACDSVTIVNNGKNPISALTFRFDDGQGLGSLTDFVPPIEVRDKFTDAPATFPKF